MVFLSLVRLYQSCILTSLSPGESRRTLLSEPLDPSIPCYIWCTKITDEAAQYFQKRSWFLGLRDIYAPLSQPGFNYFNTLRVILRLLALSSSRKGSDLLSFPVCTGIGDSKFHRLLVSSEVTWRSGHE